MMSDLRVASRYAKSLIELSIERGAVEQVHQDMLLFTKVCHESRPFELMLNSPLIPHQKKREILSSIFESKVHSLTMSIIDIITRKNREPLLPSIAKEFHIAYNHYKSIGEATVVSAAPITSDLRRKLDAIVERVAGCKAVELEEKTDPELIGGFVLKIRDQQIDTSLRTKLKALQLKLSENPYLRHI